MLAQFVTITNFTWMLLIFDIFVCLSYLPLWHSELDVLNTTANTSGSLLPNPVQSEATTQFNSNYGTLAQIGVEK